MNVKNIERNGNQATITIEIDKELMETGANKAYLKARKNIQLPGFRKGKAPRKMIESSPRSMRKLLSSRTLRLSVVPA